MSGLSLEPVFGGLRRCRVCGEIRGTLMDTCPDGAEALLDNLGEAGAFAPAFDVPRENLRLRVDDQDPEQPDLFGGSLTD